MWFFVFFTSPLLGLSQTKQQRWVYLPRYTTTMRTTIKWNYVLIFHHSNELHYVCTTHQTRRRKKTERRDSSSNFSIFLRIAHLSSAAFSHTHPTVCLPADYFPGAKRQTVKEKRAISPRPSRYSCHQRRVHMGFRHAVSRSTTARYKTPNELKIVAHLVI